MPHPGEQVMTPEQYSARHKQLMGLYDLTAAGRWDEVEAQLTDDFSIVEVDGLPYEGTWTGRDALRRLYTVVFGYWQDPELKIHDLTLSEDHGVALLSIFATSGKTGERIEMKVAEVFLLRGDKISGIRPYYFDVGAILKHV
jgi:ketosteroid isomerase-like protein